MTGSTRRGAIRRAVASLAALVGAGAAGPAALAAGREAETTTLVLHGRDLRGYGDRRRRELPRAGDRLTAGGELVDARTGAHAGRFYATGFALAGPGELHDPHAERLELHTFKLDGGTIVGAGTGGRGEGVFAIVGGTGRWAGARGTYLVRRDEDASGVGGTAEFVLTIALP